jgi:PKD repeat protein
MKAVVCRIAVVFSLLFTSLAFAAPTRTVIFMYGQTVSGQDMFMRGGLDWGYAKNNLGKDCGATADAKWLCAIPIQHNLFKDNDQRKYDKYLDWYGAEAGQGAVEGSPLVWTTNNASNPSKVAVQGYGYDPENTWGDHYWKLDVMIECSNGIKVGNDYWFELKSYISNGPGWENNVSQPGAPYTSGNHFAKCGYINKFMRGQSAVEFKALGPTAEFIQAPGAGDTSTEFTFDASRSANATAYAWDWENDGTIDVAASESNKVTKKFTTAGTYNVTLIASNGNGASAKPLIR